MEILWLCFIWLDRSASAAPSPIRSQPEIVTDYLVSVFIKITHTHSEGVHHPGVGVNAFGAFFN